MEIVDFNKILKESYVGFDDSLGKGSGYFKQIEKYTGRNRNIYEILKALYEKNNFQNVQPEKNTRIPKIIHQIWIGDRQIPTGYKVYQESWTKFHPEWKFKMWSNKEVLEYSFSDKILSEEIYPGFRTFFPYTGRTLLRKSY